MVIQLWHWLIGPQWWETGNLLINSEHLLFLNPLFRAYGNGGAIMSFDESKVTINSVLEANFAGGDGGGLASADESTILIENGALFRKNYAVGNGGGVSAAGLSATIGDMKSHAPYFAYFSIP